MTSGIDASRLLDGLGRLGATRDESMPPGPCRALNLSSTGSASVPFLAAHPVHPCGRAPGLKAWLPFRAQLVTLKGRLGRDAHAWTFRPSTRALQSLNHARTAKPHRACVD